MRPRAGRKDSACAETMVPNSQQPSPTGATAPWCPASGVDVGGRRAAVTQGCRLARRPPSPAPVTARGKPHAGSHAPRRRDRPMPAPVPLARARPGAMLHFQGGGACPALAWGSGARTAHERQGPNPRSRPVGAQTCTAAGARPHGKLALPFSCRVRLGDRRQKSGGNVPPSPGRHQSRPRPGLTYYCRLTPNCWVGRGGRGGGVLAGGSGLPLCRSRSFSSYLWAQRKPGSYLAGE